MKTRFLVITALFVCLLLADVRGPRRYVPRPLTL